MDTGFDVVHPPERMGALVARFLAFLLAVPFLLGFQTVRVGSQARVSPGERLGKIRRSAARDQVLAVLASAGSTHWWTIAQMREAASVPEGTLHGLLLRLTAAGWVVRESVPSSTPGRPQNQYQLTDLAREAVPAMELRVEHAGQAPASAVHVGATTGRGDPG